MKNYDELVSKTMGEIFEVFVEYQQGDIDINTFLQRRFNIVFEEAYIKNSDINPYEFLRKLGFDLFHEANVIRDLVK